jgi:outer membrane protein TolC
MEYGNEALPTYCRVYGHPAVVGVYGWPQICETVGTAGSRLQGDNQLERGGGWKIAKPEDALMRGKWWELYGDAKLNELEEQVDPSNQTLKMAEANFRQARTAIRFNRAAEAPTIGTSPSISAIRSSANQPYFPASLANNGSGDFTLPFDLSYEIDYGEGFGAA